MKVLRYTLYVGLLFSGLSMMPATALGAINEKGLTRLRPNVVRIECRFDGDRVEDGFGIIIAETSGRAYIVTAAHVIRGESFYGLRKSINIEYFSRDTTSRVNIHEIEGGLDLLVLEAPAPQKLDWRKDCVGGNQDTRRRTEVAYIGKTGQWYIPAALGAVAAISPVDGLITVEGLDVSRGSSGGPLVSGNGIIGMLIRDRYGECRALWIETIKTAVMAAGLPWQLKTWTLAPRFFINLNAGVAVAKLSFSSNSEFGPLGPLSYGTNSMTPVAVSLSGGIAVYKDFFISYEGLALLGEDAGPVYSMSRQSIEFIQFFAKHKYHAKLGFGRAIIDARWQDGIETSGSTLQRGLILTGGAGINIRLGKHLALTPNGSVSRYSDAGGYVFISYVLSTGIMLFW